MKEGFIIFIWIIPILQSIGFTYATETCLDRFGHAFKNPLTKPEFNVASCSYCFVNVFSNKKPLEISVFGIASRKNLNLVLKSNKSVTYYPDALKDNSEVCRTFLSDDECKTWRRCCAAARKCCNKTLQEPGPTSNGANYCPAIWDGVDCWGYSEAGTTPTRSCPEYFVAKGLYGLGTSVSNRPCDFNATWAKQTNYDSCFEETDRKLVLELSVYVGLGGNLLSMIGLLFASLVYICISGLSSDRPAKFRKNLHLSVFAAFFFMHLMLSIWDSEFYLDAMLASSTNYGKFKQNSVGCRFLYSFLWYFRSSTYFCLLSEGLYLHRRIHMWSRASATESIWIYTVINWVVPIIPVFIWSMLRLFNDNVNCWATGDPLLDLVLQVPNLIALFINLVVMCHIEKMLLYNLKSQRYDEGLQVLRRVVRATMALVPISGLQMLLIIYRPPNWVYYDMISAAVISTQGLLVSFVFCFLNKEVRIAISRSVFRYKHKRISIISTSSMATKSSRMNSVSSARANSLVRGVGSRNNSIQPTHHSIPLKEEEGESSKYDF